MTHEEYTKQKNDIQFKLHEMKKERAARMSRLEQDHEERMDGVRLRYQAVKDREVRNYRAEKDVVNAEYEGRREAEMLRFNELEEAWARQRDEEKANAAASGVND